MLHETLLTLAHAGSKADSIMFVFPDALGREWRDALISETQSLLLRLPRLCYSIHGNVEILSSERARIVAEDLYSCEVPAEPSTIAEALIRMNRLALPGAFGSLMTCSLPDGWEIKVQRFCCLHLENPEKQITAYVSREETRQFHVRIQDAEPPYARRAFLVIPTNLSILFAILSHAEEIAEAVPFYESAMIRYRLYGIDDEQIIVDHVDEDGIVRAIRALKAGR
jgi:hypothetical protein